MLELRNIFICTTLLNVDMPLFDYEYKSGYEIFSRENRIEAFQVIDGISITDNGFYDGDREIEIILSSTETNYQKCVQLVELYPSVTVSFSDGFFSGFARSLTKNENLALTVRLTSKRN